MNGTKSVERLLRQSLGTSQRRRGDGLLSRRRDARGLDRRRPVRRCARGRAVHVADCARCQSDCRGTGAHRLHRAAGRAGPPRGGGSPGSCRSRRRRPPWRCGSLFPAILARLRPSPAARRSRRLRRPTRPRCETHAAGRRRRNRRKRRPQDARRRNRPRRGKHRQAAELRKAKGCELQQTLVSRLQLRASAKPEAAGRESRRRQGRGGPITGSTCSGRGFAAGRSVQPAALTPRVRPFAPTPRPRRRSSRPIRRSAGALLGGGRAAFHQRRLDLGSGVHRRRAPN